MQKRGNPRILIAGALPASWANSDEESLLAAMLRDLRCSIPNLEATVVSNNSPGHLKQYGVAEVSHGDVRQLERAACLSDLVILGGGTIFHDRRAVNPPPSPMAETDGLAFHGAFAVMAALVGAPLMIYSVGVGPLKTGMGRALTRMVFDLASLITVRDEESCHELVELGIARERIQVCIDGASSLQSAELAASLLRAEGRLPLPSPSAATLELLGSLGVNPAAMERPRGRRLDELESEIAHSRRLNESLSAEVAGRDRIVAARDEAIAWLRGELDYQKNFSLRLTGLGESLGEQLRQLLERVQPQPPGPDPVAAARIEELDRERRAREDEIVWLRGDLAQMQAREEKLLSAARRMENDLRSRQAQLDDLARIVRARDDGINWLRGEVQAHRRLQEDLASLNLALNAEIGVRDRHLTMWREQAQQTELALLGLKISRGWRLLDRLRRVRVGLREMLGRPMPRAEAPPPVLLPDATPDSQWHEQTALLLSTLKTQIGDLWSRTPVAAAVAEPPDLWTRVRILPRPEPDDLRSFFERETTVKPCHLPDVICFSIIDWEFRFQRPQQIMAQFAARGHRVFYISTTRFQPPGSTPRAAIREIRENVFEVQLSTARTPDVYGEVIGGDNEEELLAALADLRRRLRIDEAIGYVMISSWGELALEARQRWGWRLIYDCMDEWETFPGIKTALLEMERRLVKECDLLVVTAQRLYEKWEAHAAKMVLARNAADFDFYAAHLAPNHLLTDVRRPVVGYYGAIAEWFDLDLVLFLARSRPDYTFVLIGGVFNVETAEAEALPNVRLLGQQPYERMPKYLYHFDACLIPFKVNPVTEATDPVKVYEYLSGGKPVVAVDLPELSPYAEHLYLARNREEFLEQLDRAVAEDDAVAVAARRALAREHTWAARYGAICDALRRQTPRASIVVVTYNNLELNRLCLESILRNTEYPNYEVIVVDNDSTDGTPAYLRFLSARHPQVRVILNAANEGFARANNQGIAAGEGEYVVLLNNDTVVPKGWLSRLLRHLRHAEVGMVGPVSNFVGNEARIEVAYETCAEMEAFAADHVWHRDGEAADINMLAMFCVAMRRSTYEAVGPLDEKFGVGMFEDDDYAHRLRAQGYRVICAADVFVHHVGQASFSKLIDSGEYNPLFERNRRRFEGKWNVVWSPRSSVALDFRVDYLRRGEKPRKTRK